MKTSKWICLLGLTCLMAGCSKEPMIHISEERSRALEMKIEKNSDLTDEVTADDTAVENSSADAEDQAVGRSAAITDVLAWDPAGWEQKEIVEADISQYIPFQAYQLRSYSNGPQVATVYADYEEAGAPIQASWHQAGELTTRVFAFNEGNLEMIQVPLEGSAVPFFNYLWQAGETTVLLVQPLAVGTSWAASATSEASITAIYAEAQIQEQTYEDVIEVTITEDDQADRYFLAKGQGLVAYQLHGDPEGSAWQLVDQQDEVMMVKPITVYQPQSGDGDLEATDVSVQWMTNDSLGRLFTDLFRDIDWLNEEVQVNAVTVEEGVVTLDFSPGIVAVLGSHPMGETAMMRAIIRTLADYAHVDQVRLTVNGAIMAPNLITPPADGIYQVDDPLLTGDISALENEAMEEEVIDPSAEATLETQALELAPEDESY